jgi:peptidoglycan/LPS O-acetylase OafA/YrhL
LEALRGLAALAVAAFHSWYSPWLDAAGRTHQFLTTEASDGAPARLLKLAGRMLANVDGAVLIFFVLSGFVLAGSLDRGPQAIAPAARRFAVARVFRIYPAIVAAVVIFAAVFWLTGRSLEGPESFTPAGLFSNALLLDASIDPVMWSLQVEVLAIPFVFVAYFVHRRWGTAALAAMSLVLMALSFSTTWQHAFPGVHQFGTVFAFIPGVIAYVVGRRWLQDVSPGMARFTLVAATVAFLVARPLVGITSNWSVLFEAVFGAGIVALLAFTNADQRNVLLDSPVARFYGKISYSFYLVHPLALLAMWSEPAWLGAAITAGVPEAIWAVILFAGSTALVTPLAYAMQRWIERPGIAAGRSVAKSPVSDKWRSVAVGK